VTEPAALVGPHAPNWGGSRLSKTNRADAGNGSQSRQKRPSRNRPLTDRDGVRLRAEVRDLADLDGDRPLTWDLAIDRWRAYIRDRRDVETVFENEDGARARGSKPHRFDPDYSAKQYAKLKDLERGLSREYGRRLHTAMLTFTASSTPEGSAIPAVDHLDGLLDSWDAIRRALDRSLDGRRYERLAILEPHPGDGANNGYLHVHMAVFVDGVVTRSDLAPVVDAHVRNCDLAERDAHDVDDDSTISVRHAGRDRDLDDDDALDELAIYLAEYLGTYGDDDPLDAPEHVQAANALLWATGRQRWRPSNGAQSYMATEPRDPDSEWSLVGIEKDGEFHPAEPGGGGVDTFETSTWDPPD
jgi:hypothetical protein